MSRYRHIEPMSAEVARLRREVESLKARSASSPAARPSDALHYRGDGSAVDERDDEFARTEVGTPTGWTAVQDSTPRWDFEVRWDILYGYSTGLVGTAGDYEALVRTLGSSIPTTVEGVFQLPPEQRDGLTVGVVLSDSNTWGSGTQLVAGVDQSTTTRRLVYKTLSSWNDSTVTSEVALPFDWIFVRLVWTAANTFKVLYSANGVKWKRWDSAESINLSFTPQYYGVAFTPGTSDSGQPVNFACHAVRIYAEDKDEEQSQIPTAPLAPSGLVAVNA